MTGRTVHVSREYPDEGILAGAAALFSAGGLLIYPSDTVYGLCCAAGNRKAVERLAALKGYSLPRPFVIVALDTHAALELAVPPGPEVASLLASWWPGPVSVVLTAGPACPAWVQASDGTVALRVPGDPLSSMLLRLAGRPLVSTSANAPGGAPALCVDEIDPAVTAGVDLVIDGGMLPPAVPSAVVRPVQGGIERIR